MVDLVHEVIDVTIIVVPNLREKVVDGLFHGVFDDLSLTEIQLWSPYVSEGYQTERLVEVVDRTESDYEPSVQLVINDDYTDRIEDLRDAAGSSSKDYSETGFHYLQIFEGMR